MTTKIYRVLDANINRLKEALRTLEDVQRYIYDNGELSSSFKELRHQLTPLISIDRLKYRDIEGDVSRASIESEMKRSSIDDLIGANFSRATESARVLEEAYKLVDVEASAVAKNIRYRLYHLEKKVYGF